MLLAETAPETIPVIFNLVPWIVVFPLIGLLINLIFGGRMGEKAIGAVASIASGLTFVVAVLMIIGLRATTKARPFSWLSGSPLVSYKSNGLSGLIPYP